MIRLGEPFRGLLYTPFYLVHGLGLFEAEGVEVELVQAPSPAQAATELLAGTTDVCWGGPMRVMHHHDREPGCSLVLFAEAVTRDPFFLVGREPLPGFEPAHLSQMRLATVSEVPTPWLCLQEDLRRAGMEPDALDRIGDRSMEQNVEALRKGEVDVVQVFEPWVEALLAEGTGHIWHAAARRGHTAYTSFYTRRETLAVRAAELLRMTRALYGAERWLKAAPAGEVSALLSPWFPGLSPAVLAGAVGRYQALGVWSDDPVLRREGFDRLKAGLLSGGWIARDIPFETCVDTTLAGQVLSEGPPPPEPPSGSA